MNDRIQQLAEQATSVFENMDGEWYEDFDKEEFARLIVQECGAVALNIGCGDIEDELLKHFGVAE
jgi:hypothetical protein